MLDEDKMIKMFTEVYGEMTGSCYTEIEYNDMMEPCGVNLMKDGNLCWGVTIAELTFLYLTKDWE